MATLLAEHNIPLAFAKHLNKEIPKIFDDSKVAQRFSFAATKTTCMINGAIAPHFLKETVETIKESPFSLLTDGSNDTGLEKMNPLTVRIFDIRNQKVESRFLDMCATTGKDAATAATIFDKINEVLEKHEIPWGNCVGFGVDNTNVNVGTRNSIMTRVKQKNDACYFMGCPCHLLHNIACKASESFSDTTEFNLEDICIDVYYYFDKSSKRKSLLDEYAEFCEIDYRQIIKHVNTRWLRVETVVRRNLDMYPALKSYFLSTSESTTRFKRLKKQFRDPMVEVYHLFYQAVLPTFTVINKFLQREDPCIYAAHEQLHDFVSRLLKEARTWEDVNYTEENVQLNDRQLFVGIQTRQTVNRLVNDGSVDERKRDQFYAGVRSFYETAAAEALSKLPLDDETLKHAKFVNFAQREHCSFDDVEFFVTRYPTLLSLSAPELEMMQEEFIEYQLLEHSNIPDSVWEEAKLKDDSDQASAFRMDVIWGYLSSLKLTNGTLKFGRISKVAKIVLVLPHSNAGEERVFSLVRKNKTSSRPSLKVDGTLASLLTIKMSLNQTSFEPPKELLKSAKKATSNYNKEHRI